MQQTIDLRGLERKHGLPVGLLQSVMQVESGGNIQAISPRGAKGLFQFMPATAEQYSIDPMNPLEAADGAARMYADLFKQYNGDIDKALAAYNWGSGNLAKHGVEGMPKETRKYIASVKRGLPKQYADAGNVMTDAQYDTAPQSGKYTYMLLGDGSEMRSAPAEFLSSPTSNVSPENDPSKMAGFGTQAAASFPTDIKERAAYFAKQRFPDDPNAISRYGVQDGRLFYMADDGGIYFEEPKASLSFGETPKYLASTAGPALPIIGSIAGGLFAAVPGAGAGAAVGDEVRQGLAMTMSGQKEFSPWQTIKEGVTGAVGEGIGIGVGKVINRNAARDITKLASPEAQARIDYLEAAAKEFGLTLTPAEKTGLPSLRDQQNVLGSLPRSGDILSENLYTPRNTEQIPSAVDKMMGRISPTESTELGAQNLKSGAESVIKAEQQTLQTQAKPFYDASRNTTIPSSDYEKLTKDPFLRQQMKRVMSDPKYQTDIGDLFPQSGRTTASEELDQYGVRRIVESKEPPIDAKVGFLDVVKRHIDGMIEAEKSGAKPNRNNVRIYKAARDRLVKIADDASPEYAKARSIYEDGMPSITALTKGEVGLAAKSKQTNLDHIPKIIFGAGPNSVKANRYAFVKAGKEQEWNDGLRSYLQDSFDRAAKEYKSGNTNPGGAFRASVFGTQKQRASMRSAMSTDQWLGFNRLMDVLEASGKVQQGGSRTAFAGEAIQDMKQKSGGIVSKGIRALNPSNLFDTARVAKAYEQFRFGQHSEKLAEIITSPDGIKQLKALKALPPRSVKAMAITSQLLTQYGIGEASEPGDVDSFSND